MALKDLQEFIKTFEEKGEIKRITTKVDSTLEITEIADKVLKMWTSNTF
ncbi:hypothetical protein [Clostridium sp.]